MKGSFTIGMAQLKVTTDDISLNAKESESWFIKARKSSCDLLVFPEIHLSTFFPQYSGRNDLAQALSIESEEIKIFQEYAKKYGINCIPNIYLEEHSKYYDASIAIDKNGKIRSVAKMMHIAQQHHFYEQDYYTPSNTGFQVIDFGVCKVGIIICFDRHYSESYRACLQQGADIIIIPTANTKNEPMGIFNSEIQAAAFQNSVAIAMVNRVGVENEMSFSGQSIVVMSDGSIVDIADDTETFLVCTIDIDKVRLHRSKSPYHELNRFRTELFK